MRRATTLFSSTLMLVMALVATSCRDATPAPVRGSPVLEGVTFDGADRDAVLDFETVLVHETATRTLVFLNSGPVPYVVTDVEDLDGLAGEFTFALEQAMTVEPAGAPVARQPFELSFTPRAEGEREGRLIFWLQSADVDEIAVTVRARAVDPRCQILVDGAPLDLDGRLDFGKAVIDRPATRQFEIRNGSAIDWDLTLGAIDNGVDGTLGSSAGFALEEGDALVTIPAGGSKVVRVRFTPQRPGPYGGLLAIVAPRGCQPSPLPLVGEGVDDTLVCDWTVDFGPVALGSEARATATCRNDGSSAITMTLGEPVQPTGSSAAPFRLLDPERVRTLEPGDAPWSIGLAFLPSVPGPQVGKLPFTSNDPKRGVGQITLAGVGGGPRIDVVSTLGFGTAAVGVAKPRDLVIRNGGDNVEGDDDARLRFVTVEGGISRVAQPVVLDARSDEYSSMFSFVPNGQGGAFPDGFDPDRGLAARETVSLRLVFSASAAGDHAARLLIYTNDPANPVKTVLLTGTAYQLEPCAAVYERRLDYGTLEPNTILTRRLTILNDRPAGADPSRYSCIVSDLRFDDGSDAAFRFVDAADPDFPGPEGILLAPADRLTIPIVFAPTAPRPYSAQLAFYVSRPDGPEAGVALTGFGGSSCLEVLPKELRFGTVALSCQSIERNVVIRNGCSYGIKLGAAPVIESTGQSPFALTRPPSANLPLAPGYEVSIPVRYRPLEVGQDEAALIIEWMDGSNKKTSVVSLVGTAQTTSRQTERFVAEARPAVDTLFVIDNSYSMNEEHHYLGTNFEAFISVAAQHQADFHIAVTTTDTDAGGENGRFVPLAGTSAQRILTPELGPAALKAQFLSNVLGVGVNGSGDESLIYPAYNALRHPLLSGANQGFLRQNARLSIIVVSDARDHDPVGNPVTFYERFFRTIKGPDTANGVRFSGIVPTLPVAPPNPECSYDEYGDGDSPRVKDLAAALNGIVREICEAGWDRTLVELGEGSYAPVKVFNLLNYAIPRSIEVRINGEITPAVNPDPPYNRVWRYDSTANAIVFDDNHEPQAGQTLVVEYDTACIAAP